MALALNNAQSELHPLEEGHGNSCYSAEYQKLATCARRIGLQAALQSYVVRKQQSAGSAPLTSMKASGKWESG
jgi:hypothetical protein